MDFRGFRIAGARVHADLTMEEAAKRLGISKNTLYVWEHDETRVPPYAVNALSDLYQVPIELLMCSENMPKASGEEEL